MLNADSDNAPSSAPLITGQVWWFLLFSFIGNSCLTMLFAVLPLFAESVTGITLMAGAVTGAMMAATVVVELVTPRLIVALGYRRVMEIGLVLIGFPALVLITQPTSENILTVAIARGAGLAITVVAGTTLAANLFPIHRRAEGLGVYGVAISIPAIAVLPFGLWLADRYGPNSSFAITAVLASVGLTLGSRLPTSKPGNLTNLGIVVELQEPGILRPTIVFGISTVAIGILITYLALAVPDDARHIAAVGFFIQAACTSAARWGAGWLGDRVGSSKLLAPSMLLAGVGMLALTVPSVPGAVLAGMALFGIGLGGAQNSSLSTMLERAPQDRVPQISVIWNLAYDAGMGVGAAGFGLLSTNVGYSWGFAIVAMILFVTVPTAWRDRVRNRNLSQSTWSIIRKDFDVEKLPVERAASPEINGAQD